MASVGARTGIGLAVNPGAPLPDISGGNAFVVTLLAARSVAYSRTGAGGIYFAELIERLGNADARVFVDFLTGPIARDSYRRTSLHHVTAATKRVDLA